MTPFDWDEYLEIAEQWVNQRGNPAAERSAISRAYYAVFHRALQHYVGKGNRATLLGVDHQLVVQWFKAGPNLEYVKIGTDLGRLKQLRRDADYNDRIAGLSAQAQTAVLTARKTLQALLTL